MKKRMRKLGAIILAGAMTCTFSSAAYAGQISENNVLGNAGEEELSLSYDDRYDINDAYPGYKIVEGSVKTKEVTSYKVSGGKETSEKDSSVIKVDTSDGKQELKVSGVGEATVQIKKENSTITLDVTAEPARLTMMYLMGQSNMEGMCSNNLGYTRDRSVACEPGTVYSTYAPTISLCSQNITGNYISTMCDSKNASAFVPASLTSDVSISGDVLKYNLDTLTSEGDGKTGLDGAIAYEWNKKTGDKVWTVNTAWSGSRIWSWQKGMSNYERAMAVSSLAESVAKEEIKAGHYTEGESLMFWLQGETEDRSQKSSEYVDLFRSMYQDISANLEIDACGLIIPRSAMSSNKYEDEWYMTGSRLAQYGIGGDSDICKNVYVVSAENEQWISDKGVVSYFNTKYPNGIDYPMHTSDTVVVPTTVNDVHADIHYSQIGHNENGFLAADGMYQVLYGTDQSKQDYSGFHWRNEKGATISSMAVRNGQSEALASSMNTLSNKKSITYKTIGKGVSYDPITGMVSGLKAGSSATIIAYGTDGSIISSIPVNVLEETDYSQEVGDSYTGLYKDQKQNKWYYLVNGKVDYSFNGFVQNEYGWWYIENGTVTFQKYDVIKGTVNGETAWWKVVGSKVTFDNDVCKNSNGWWVIRNGKVDFTYTGFAENSNGWWYCKNGQVCFDDTDVIKGTVNNETAWWKVVGSKVTFDNDVCKNSNGWWVIRNGKVDFTYTGFAENSNGWWYCKNGQVCFDDTDVIKGTVKGEEGWWKVVESKVIFDNDVCKNENGWWKITNGKVDFSYTGLAQNSNGWWYLVNGKVDFTADSVVKNNMGWWKVTNGQVDFGFTGIAQNQNGWWWIENGKVNFDKTGYVTVSGKIYYVSGGKVVKN